MPHGDPENIRCCCAHVLAADLNAYPSFGINSVSPRPPPLCRFLASLPSAPIAGECQQHRCPQHDDMKLVLFSKLSPLRLRLQFLEISVGVLVVDLLQLELQK